MLHMIDRLTAHAHCGGTLLDGGLGSPDTAHTYCDRCRAFKYDAAEGSFPTGTDRDANAEAWDLGEDRSPDEDGFTCPSGGDDHTPDRARLCPDCNPED